MRYALVLVATVCWALWFGATIATFVFGLHYFHHLPRETAADAANAMFAAFATYQMAVAGVALLAAGLLLVTWPSRGTIGLLACLLTALAMAVTFGLGLLPIMQGMRHQGLAGTPEYMRMHGRSMAVQSIQALALLATGAVLVGIGGPAKRGLRTTDFPGVEGSDVPAPV